MTYIREAVLSDEEPIYQLMIDLEGPQVNRDLFSEIYRANLSCHYIYYFVAEEQEKIVGFVSVHIQKLLHHTENIAEIQELIVLYEARGCGVGQQLFQKTKEIAQKNNCVQLEVCCNKKRLSSHKFYEAQEMSNNHYKFCLVLKN